MSADAQIPFPTLPKGAGDIDATAPTAFTVTASVLWVLELQTAAYVAVAMLAVAASLEAFLGFCLGCVIFGQLMRWKLIPESVCEDCNDISRRYASSAG